ncbi:carboxymuconolactone decarboxylase family protein [Oceanibacterium hippocampi]|uniref:Carboxymuconolactone decarboxylase family protein n=1 Tax=Oceanibacterium hippocampi TaxID=745714 RepID=A0A1Y5SS26_9PROT|nr:carboxymuconolactone decarboxylase family protein [Oceanibacterium hippocampi]SLN46934.1 Carboxymuconolactone decarboxylase family protein [Oceanibacterium hippocampi]
MKLFQTRAVLTAASIVAFGASIAAAQDRPSLEETYKDIEAVYGVTPEYMKVYPKQGIAAAWELTKSLEVEKGALDPKIKSLINIAVAAQIPCRYCIWLDTRFARELGATDEEIAEAVAQAGLTRHWSAILNGMQIDFETFKAEFGGD